MLWPFICGGLSIHLWGGIHLRGGHPRAGTNGGNTHSRASCLNLLCTAAAAIIQRPMVSPPSLAAFSIQYSAQSIHSVHCSVFNMQYLSSCYSILCTQHSPQAGQPPPPSGNGKLYIRCLLKGIRCMMGYPLAAERD